VCAATAARRVFDVGIVSTHHSSKAKRESANRRASKSVPTNARHLSGSPGWRNGFRVTLSSARLENRCVM
ncbi:MAG TPA: hypothetical protein VIS78_02135, partial [Blastocatellia bacterium]